MVQEINVPEYKQQVIDIGGGLSMRWSTSADAENVAELVGDAFRVREGARSCSRFNLPCLSCRASLLSLSHSSVTISLTCSYFYSVLHSFPLLVTRPTVKFQASTNLLCVAW